MCLYLIGIHKTRITQQLHDAGDDCVHRVRDFINTATGGLTSIYRLGTGLTTNKCWVPPSWWSKWMVHGCGSWVPLPTQLP